MQTARKPGNEPSLDLATLPVPSRRLVPSGALGVNVRPMKASKRSRVFRPQERRLKTGVASSLDCEQV